MPGTKGSELSVAITIGEKKSNIKLTAPSLSAGGRAKSLELKCPLVRSQLDGVRASARRELDDFAKAANSAKKGLARRWQLLDQAMLQLRKLGNSLAYSLFEWQDLPKVEDFCRRACRQDEERSIIPQVEIVLDDLSLLPFEFIPLFRFTSPLRTTDAQSFIQEASSYLGFKTVIKRTIRKYPGQGERLIGAPGFDTKIFQHALAPSVPAVISMLKRLTGGTNEVFPKKRLSQFDFENQMSDFLKSAEESLFYFHCHCDTSDPSALRHSVFLSDGTTEYPMDLKTVVSGFATRGGFRSKPGPLVFMNACGGASVLPSGQFSLPGLFLQNRSRGYIGTESIIPDETAGIFARLFFERFLNGTNLGESMFGARSDLLYRGNPLGILYTAYAPSEMLAVRKH